MTRESPDQRGKGCGVYKPSAWKKADRQASYLAGNSTLRREGLQETPWQAPKHPEGRGVRAQGKEDWLNTVPRAGEVVLKWLPNFWF